MSEEHSGHSSLDLKREHVEILLKYLKPSVKAQQLVNINADNTRPSIKSIVSFTLPADFLPAFPRTFGDIGKSFETIGKLGDTKFDYLRTNDRGVSMLAMRMWIMIVVMMAIVSDEKGGSVPHVDAYKQELDRIQRKKQEEEQRKKAKGKGKQDDVPDKAQEEEGEKEIDIVPDEELEATGKQDQVMEAEEAVILEPEDNMDVDQDQLDFDNVLESTMTEAEIPKSDELEIEEKEEKEQEEEGTTNNKKKNKKKKKSKPTKRTGKTSSTKKMERLERVQKSKADHGAGAETASSNLGSTEEDIRRSRVKTREDTSCVSHFEYLSNAKKVRDMRGRICKLSGEFLTFLYNGKRYPKVYTFIEELEGHVEMPIEKTRITLDAQLYNHPDGMYSGLTKEEEDRMSGKGAVGNGKIVGYRFWFFVMDKSFSLVQQLRRLLADKEVYDALRKGAGFEKCPIEIFSKPLDEIRSESDLFSKTCVPLLSFGSGFRNVTDDPIIQNITQITKGVFSAEEMMNEREKDFSGDRTGEPGDKYHRYYETSAKYSYNKDKDIDIADFMSHRTTFSEFMGSVCDIQRSPEQYFRIQKLHSSQNRHIVSKRQTSNNMSPKDKVVIEKPITSPKPIDEIDTFDLETKFKSSDSDFDTTQKKYDSVLIEDVEEDEEKQTQSSSQDDISDFVKVNRDEFQKNEQDYYLAGYKTREEYEFRLREIYDMMQHVNPDQFTGFPVPQRVMFVNSLCTGLNFCNVPLPHVMMDIYYHDKKKVVLEAQYKIHEKSSDLEEKSVVSPTAKKSPTENEDNNDVLDSLNKSSSSLSSSSGGTSDPVDDGLNKMEQVIELMFSAKTKLSSDEETSFRQDGGDVLETTETGAPKIKNGNFLRNGTFITNMQRLWYQIENNRMNIGACVSIRDISPKSQYEFIRQAEKISDSFKSISQNVTMEALNLLLGQKLISVKTPSDVEFFSAEQFDPNFPECRNGEISLSELLQFGQKNALLALRIKRYFYLSLIRNRYPDMGERYKRALAEHNRDYFQKFCHVMRSGSNLCSSQIGVMNWWTSQARLGRLFACIPLNYANLSIFGNGIQFLRGVWSGVCLGRNNVDLFLLEMACYWTALEYNWGLRNHLIVSAEHTASKSFTMTAVQSLAVEKTFVKVTYESDKSMFTDQDEYQRVDAYDEIPPIMVSDVNSGGKSGGQSDNSEAVRVNKEVMAHGRFSMKTNTFEKLHDGTVLRKNTYSCAVNQATKMGNNNLKGSDRDAPKMQRVLYFPLAKKDGSYYRALPEEAGRDGETSAKLLGGDRKHGMRSNQQDIAKISLPNKDYIGPDEAHTKGVVRLVHAYMFLTNCLIFAGLLEEPSLDVAERLMVAILEEYTKQKNIKSVISRKLFQFLNWVKGFICFDAVITTLFTNVFHQHLKYEKVVVTEQKYKHGDPEYATSSAESNGEESTTYKKTCRRQKDYLNIEEFADSIQKHMHAKTEHVVMACTMAEPFICDQYEPNILNCIASRAYWPIGNIQYIRKVHPLESGKNNCKIHEWVCDPRYICIYGARDVDITYAIYIQMQEELGMTVSQNDVSRVLDQLANKLHDACACLLVAKDQWLANKINLERKDKIDSKIAQQLKTGKLPTNLAQSSLDSDTTKKSTSEKKRTYGTQDSMLSKDEELLYSSSAMSSSSSSKTSSENPPVDSPSESTSKGASTKKSSSSTSGNLTKEQKRRLLIEESQRKLNEQFDETNERNAKRAFVPVYRDGEIKKCFQPWDVERMLEWFLRKYETYDDMIQDISTNEEAQKACGIVSYQVFKAGEYFWMRFDRSVVDTESVPVARKDGTDGKGKGELKQRRYSLLIEHLQHSPKNTMENAIKTVLDRCSAVPPGCNVYMSARTLVGLNQDTGKEEASAYLNQAIEIEHGSRVLHFVAPKAGSADDEKYLFSDEQLDNLDYFKIPKYDKEGNLIKQPEFPNLTIKKRSSVRTDEDYYYGRLSESLKKQYELQSFVDPSKMTVQQINDAIIKIISSSKGVKLEKISLDFFGQLRHWVRCGIDPREQIELVASSSRGGGKCARMTSIAELYSSHFMNMTIQDMILEKARVRESLGRDPCIVRHYPSSLWISEYKANIEKSRLSQSSCMDVATMFTQVLGIRDPNTGKNVGPPHSKMIPTGITAKQLSQQNPFSLSFVTGPSLDAWTFGEKYKKRGPVYLPTQIAMAMQANKQFMEEKYGPKEDDMDYDDDGKPLKHQKSKILSKMAALPGAFSSHIAHAQIHYADQLAKVEKRDKALSQAFYSTGRGKGDKPLKLKDFRAATLEVITSGFQVPNKIKPKHKKQKKDVEKTKKKKRTAGSSDDDDEASRDSDEDSPLKKKRKLDKEKEVAIDPTKNTNDDEAIEELNVDEMGTEEDMLSNIDFDPNDTLLEEEEEEDAV